MTFHHDQGVIRGAENALQAFFQVDLGHQKHVDVDAAARFEDVFVGLSFRIPGNHVGFPYQMKRVHKERVGQQDWIGGIPNNDKGE
jgi:hypothetical protein